MAGAHSQATFSPLGLEREAESSGMERTEEEVRLWGMGLGRAGGKTMENGRKTKGYLSESGMAKIRKGEMMMVNSVDHHLTAKSSRI